MKQTKTKEIIELEKKVNDLKLRWDASIMKERVWVKDTLNLVIENEMKHRPLENKSRSTSIATIICASILGVVALLGAFFGREGLINVGIGILMSVLLLLFCVMYLEQRTY